MKSIKLIGFVLIVTLLFATGCGKKVMENKSSADGNSQSATSAEAAGAKPEPKSEPVTETQTEDTPEQLRAKFLNQMIYFDFDSAVLREDAQEALQAKAQWLKDNTDVATLLVEGHCDDRGTDAYNMALGEKRAEVVKTFLVDLGVDGSKLNTRSYGEERPAVEGGDENAWAQNRRASFVIE